MADLGSYVITAISKTSLLPRRQPHLQYAQSPMAGVKDPTPIGNWLKNLSIIRLREGEGLTVFLKQVFLLISMILLFSFHSAQPCDDINENPYYFDYRNPIVELWLADILPYAIKYFSIFQVWLHSLLIGGVLFVL